MVSSQSWSHYIEQVLCCFVGIYSKQLLFVALFFFFDQGMESPPLDAMKILVLDRFGIIPDNKYLV